MSIKAEIIADSINPKGCRLTTYILEFPRFILAELATHRVFSKNAASSRAIPIEKMIEQVQTNPAMPVWWGKNQSGMQAKEELNDVEQKEHRWSNELGETGMMEFLGLGGRYLRYNGFSQTRSYNLTDKEAAKVNWLLARNEAISSVRKLMAIGLHKQIANRLLEPWFNIRVILSGTEFENFFALRAHPDAQPELQALAYKMLEEYNKSEPKRLQPGEWHVPFEEHINIGKLQDIYKIYYDYNESTTIDVVETRFGELRRKIAIARCARVSYFNHEGKDDYEADIKLCDRLFGSVPRHLSPTEHVAQCLNDDQFIGNFRGWQQYRYFFDDQNLRDARVKK